MTPQMFMQEAAALLVRYQKMPGLERALVQATVDGTKYELVIAGEHQDWTKARTAAELHAALTHPQR